MQLYMTDKAIEFNSEYEKLERVLNALKEAHIDVSSEKKEIQNLKTTINHDVLNMYDSVKIENMYVDGIKKLKEITYSLKKYEVYYRAYNDAEIIERKIINNEVKQDELKTYSQFMINLLNKINTSETRAFSSEEKVVNKVYDTAYSIIKLELLTKGESAVLTWVKNDSIASNLIDTRIFKEIDSFMGSSVYSEIKNKLANINSNLISEKSSNITSDLNYTGLDEGLILFLALQDKQNIEVIEDDLFQTINELLESEREKRNQEFKNNELNSGIQYFNSNIQNSKLYKQIALALGFIALLIGIKQGSNDIAKNIGHNEFKTRLEYYSSEGENPPEYPEYMEKIQNNSLTILKAYSLWNRENIFYGDYQREVITFDISNLELENLADYASLDFSELDSMSYDVETASDLDASMLYNEAIVEITRLIQDPNDQIFVPNEEAQKIFITVMSTIEASLALIGGTLITGLTFKKIKERIKNGTLRKSELATLNYGLQRYEELCNKNEKFKKRFIQSYQKYAQIIQNKELKEKCDDIFARIKSK